MKIMHEEIKKSSDRPRLAQLKPAEMDERRKAFYDDVITNLDRPGLPHVTRLSEGELIGPFTAMLNFPEYGEPLYRLQLRLIQQSRIPRDVCEVFILTVVCFERASYAIYAHELLALDAGVPAEVVKRIRTGDRPLSDCPAIELAYALAVTLSSGGVVPRDVYEAALSEFGRDGLNVLINTAGLFKYLSTLMNAYDEPVPEPAR